MEGMDFKYTRASKSEHLKNEHYVFALALGSKQQMLFQIRATAASRSV